MLTIDLTRHGQTEANRDKHITGQLDSPLTPKGQEQAKALAEILRPISLAAFYTSTLGRTGGASLPCSRMQGIPLQTLPTLNTKHVGMRKHNASRL